MAKVLVRGTKNIPKFKPVGCYRPIYNLEGMVFGSQKVIRLVSANPVKWLCECECGAQSIKKVSEITRDYQGRSNSCGCHRKKFLHLHAKEFNQIPNHHTQHGDARYGKVERLYRVWLAMRQRCTNTKCNGYQYYGSRGIRVCDEWQDYAVFKEWALDNGYHNELTLDRIDVDGDYCPENCRWTDWHTQAANTRRCSNTGVVGVSLSNGRYSASLCIRGERFEKKFRTLEDAVAYRKKLERKFLSCAA